MLIQSRLHNNVFFFFFFIIDDDDNNSKTTNRPKKQGDTHNNMSCFAPSRKEEAYSIQEKERERETK